MINDGYDTSFGDEKAREGFARRHIALLKAVPNLKRARQVALDQGPQQTFEYRLMFVLQQIVCEEDFDSIVTLCANGFSMTAMQILRAMFEHTVTLAHIGKNPDEAKQFWDYYWMDLHELERERLEKLAPELKQQIEENNHRVRNGLTDASGKDSRFWSQSNIMEMARDLGLSDDLIRYVYHRPLEETHGTAAAILKRIEVTTDLNINFNPGPKPAEDSMMLMLAHQFVIAALRALKQHCKVKALEIPIAQCEREYHEIWTLKREVIAQTR